LSKIFDFQIYNLLESRQE
jgi:hypothetical protein